MKDKFDSDLSCFLFSKSLMIGLLLRFSYFVTLHPHFDLNLEEGKQKTEGLTKEISRNLIFKYVQMI